MDLTKALTLIQMDYVEMPELLLTVQQGRRLWTLPIDVCQAALDTLVATGFLLKTQNGLYRRRGTPPVVIEALDPQTWVAGGTAA
jgi:hypothetical protein